MDHIADYLSVNKELWNGKTPHHVASAFYDMPSFMAGHTSLNSIELDLLGDVKGKRILHLQCHFGKDSLSLARMGAKVTGIDFSEEAIAKAHELNDILGLDAEFICTDLYNLPSVLSGEYDIVFSSYGTICWLPDMDRWAQVAASFVKPGGHFIFVEFHPAIWMMDEDFKGVKYAYFNKEAIIEAPAGTYADRNAPIQHTEITWNHNLAEVLQPLLQNGLQLQSIQEFDYSPYNCFRDTIEIAKDKYQVRGVAGKFPMVYAIKMIR